MNQPIETPQQHAVVHKHWVAVKTSVNVTPAEFEVWDMDNNVIAVGLSEENALLMASAHELAEALRELHDLQNGPPLEKNREQWNAAMEFAEMALRNAGNK